MNYSQKILVLLVHTLSLQFLSLYWSYNLGKTSRFSIFFDQKTQSQQFEIQERSSEAASLMYLNSKNLSHHWHLNSSVPHPFCITIVTKKRLHAEYIIRSTAYLLSRLEVLQHDNGNSLTVKVYITNTERPQTEHKVLSAIKTVVDIVNLEDFERSKMPGIVSGMDGWMDNPSRTSADDYHTWLRNEALDTALMLDFAEGIGCEDLMVLEDDGIVSKDFYTKIQKAMKAKKSVKYFAMKLFYSDTFTGWSRDPEDVLLLFVSTGILALLFAVIPLAVIKIRLRAFDKRPLVISAIYFWLFYIGLFLAIGKQSLFPKYQGEDVLKLGRHMGSTVGVVYPRIHFRGTSNFLKNKVGMMDNTPMVDWNKKDLKPVDLMLDDYADKILELDTYLILPNVVQHIGRFSSADSRNKGSLKALSQSNSFPPEDEQF